MSATTKMQVVSRVELRVDLKSSTLTLSKTLLAEVI